MFDESQRSEPGSAYAARVAAEENTFRNCIEVHELPAIFHYWSNRYVRPKLESLGFITPNDLFRKYASELCGRSGNGPVRLVSIGAGNCDLEDSLALQLRSAGYTEFVIDCLEMNAAMLERGRAAAEKSGVLKHLNFVQVDLNDWKPAQEYDGVLANQILHHVVKLEDLFGNIRQCLKPEGIFLVSDMIGRNGHQRWPEALETIQEFWRKLPPSYRFNRTLQRYEETFEDWDCSVEGFEGIRSQDILPLLLEQFHFHLFFGFANLIDPFVDRAFGYHFDAQAAWDRNFIDEVNRADEEQIASGRIKPTHMLAVLGKQPAKSRIVHESLTPEFGVRGATERPAATAGSRNGARGAYDWQAWPHDPHRELEIACERMKGFQDTAVELEKEVATRTEWALELERQLEERTAWALRLDKEIDEFTAWSVEANKEIERLNHGVQEQAALAQRLQQEVDARDARVRDLSGEMKRLEWAQPLDRRFHKLLDAAYRIARRVRGRRGQE
jgi:SAM-dependent methyltransferase